MPRTLPRLATLAGALLMSRGARRFAGRHAGKLALAALALKLFEEQRTREADQTGPKQPHPRRRWSGRRP